MPFILERLAELARLRPGDVALVSDSQSVSFAALQERIEKLAGQLTDWQCRTIALAADNGTDWIITDLAAWAAGATLIPVPLFFAPQQIAHMVETGAVDTMIVPRGDHEASLPGGFERYRGEADGLVIYGSRSNVKSSHNHGCAKITYTSGSTGTPRGVRLAGPTLDDIVRRLAKLFEDLHIRRHLCTMPLATLLENVAGVYVPLSLGATVYAPALSQLGLYGSSRIDADRFCKTIEATGAESLILQPQTLRELSSFLRGAGHVAPLSLKFAAVGGAKVAQADLDDAAGLGIPAYQGYGLSECASVVALNLPGACKAGSVGRPLPGLSIEIAEDGEILVDGQAMLGYANEAGTLSGPVATGDIGHQDPDGFLYVTGRKKNLFITGFGRNVAPEWPESLLLHEPEIAQACVFGESMPFNTAVIVPAPGAAETHLAHAVARANRELPDYARIGDWIVTEEPFNASNGLSTTTGKPRRDAIAQRYLPDTSPALARQEPRSGARSNGF